jgi:mono/diheme cytochrome c family protein
MKNRGLLISIVLCSVAALLGAPQEKKIRRVPATRSDSIKGADLFLEYCAVCHGRDGRGGGPAAEALKKSPADLTQISRKNGGEFPTIQMQRIIKGDDVLAAHGSRDMPTWGSVFRGFERMDSSAFTELRVANLTKYLEQVQAK